MSNRKTDISNKNVHQPMNTAANKSIQLVQGSSSFVQPQMNSGVPKKKGWTSFDDSPVHLQTQSNAFMYIFYEINYMSIGCRKYGIIVVI